MKNKPLNVPYIDGTIQKTHLFTTKSANVAVLEKCLYVTFFSRLLTLEKHVYSL
jgi:hypothetical protein